MPVRFHHPSYDHQEPFLILDALDSDLENPNQRGLLHQLALDACRIVANNENGFLSSTGDSSGRIPTATTILYEGDYWFFLLNDGLPKQYPIIDDFQAWSFPSRMPDHWTAARPTPAIRRGQPPSNVPAAVKDADQSCVVTRRCKHLVCILPNIER